MRELRERAEPLLRIVVIILAVVVVFRFAGIIKRWNPFRGVTVPEVPTLAAGTNAPAGGGHGSNAVVATASTGTNGTQHSTGTNAAISAGKANTNSTATLALKGTNSVTNTNLATAGTNAMTNAVAVEADFGKTNSVPATNTASTDASLSTTATTNASPTATSANTNSTAPVATEMTNTNSGTNVVARAETPLHGTNSVAATNSADKGTNALLSSGTTGTNAAPGSKKKKGGPAMPPEMAGMNFNPFGPPGKSSVELPPAVKSRISKITDSEILGPVMHPLPMGLLGIAGNVAFLRSASGQTGLVKEGDSLDDIKLLRIGMNRVLIELNGQKQELMIFDGYGGGSLLPNNSTNENNHP